MSEVNEKISNSRLKEKKNTANQFVRECMVTAVIYLLKEKKLSEISISELTEKAGVSRMAYYRNYSTKEDIFIQHLDDIFDQYYYEYHSADQSNFFYSKENMLHCFHYFSIHREFLNSLFESNYGNLFLEKLSNYIISMWFKDTESLEQYFILHSFAGSLYNVFRIWSLTPCSTSEESLAEIIYQIFKKTP